MKILAWIHDWVRDHLFGKPKRRRTAPPACPFCGGRGSLACSCGRRHGCMICAGTGIIPAAAIAGGPCPDRLVGYARAFEGN